MLELEFPLHGGINGLAAARREVVWTEDYLADPRSRTSQTTRSSPSGSASGAWPPRPSGRPAARSSGPWRSAIASRGRSTPDELELLQGMADIAAIAVDKAACSSGLGASEERYRFLIESAPDMVWRRPTRRSSSSTTESIESLLGWRVEELVGKPLLDPHPRGFARGRRPLVASWTEPGVERTFRLHARHRDGHGVPYECGPSALATANSRASRALARRDGTRPPRARAARVRGALPLPDRALARHHRGRSTHRRSSPSSAAGARAADRLDAGRGRRPALQFVELLTPSRRARGDARRLADPSRTRPRSSSTGCCSCSADGRADPGRGPRRRHRRATGVRGRPGSIRDMSDRDRMERELRRQEAEIAAARSARSSPRSSTTR